MFLFGLFSIADESHNDLFEKLYNEHNERLQKIAYDYLGNEQDTEDVLQEAYIKVFHNIKSFENIDSEYQTALLVVFVERTAIDFLRKKGCRIKPMPLTSETDDGETRVNDIPDYSQIPDDIIINHDIAERLAKCIEQLPEHLRDVIVMKYFYDIKEKEIAKEFGITENAVALRISRAKGKLLKMLKKEI